MRNGRAYDRTWGMVKVFYISYAQDLLFFDASILEKYAVFGSRMFDVEVVHKTLLQQYPETYMTISYVLASLGKAKTSRKILHTSSEISKVLLTLSNLPFRSVRWNLFYNLSRFFHERRRWCTSVCAYGRLVTILNTNYKSSGVKHLAARHIAVASSVILKALDYGYSSSSLLRTIVENIDCGFGYQNT